MLDRIGAMPRSLALSAVLAAGSFMAAGCESQPSQDTYTRLNIADTQSSGLIQASNFTTLHLEVPSLPDPEIVDSNQDALKIWRAASVSLSTTQGRGSAGIVRTADGFGILTVQHVLDLKQTSPSGDLMMEIPGLPDEVADEILFLEFDSVEKSNDSEDPMVVLSGLPEATNDAIQNAVDAGDIEPLQLASNKATIGNFATASQSNDDFILLTSDGKPFDNNSDLTSMTASDGTICKGMSGQPILAVNSSGAVTNQVVGTVSQVRAQEKCGPETGVAH